MPDVNVLVVFYSRYGTTERLALAAGLGAIQAKASIRLRRLADAADAVVADRARKEALERMTRDYVVPRPADPVWADVVVLATPDDTSTEITTYCASLRALGPMAGKIAAPLAPGNRDASLGPVYAAAACAGLTVVPAQAGAGDEVAAAREYGRRVTQLARSLKQSARV